MQDDTILQTKGLSKNFGKVKAVENLSISVKPGSIYGFLGRNGAGKTTTIRMLMGIVHPSKGEISILGETSKRITKIQKQMIGYVSQENYFYQWMTCRDMGNFVSGFYPTWDSQEYKRLLQVMELPEDRKIRDLSGGMKVKSALALALAYRPKLLILDEPTSGLDPAARKEFLTIIANQAQKYGRTTFFSSHIIGEVEQIASHISIIDRGQKKYEGTVEQLQGSVKKVLCPPFPVREANQTALTDYLKSFFPDDYIRDTTSSTFRVLSGFTNEKETGLTVYTDLYGWESFLPPELEVRSLTLEDIFISLTEKGTAL